MNDPPTADTPSLPTPDSGHSVYFDAPIMHFTRKKDNEEDGLSAQDADLSHNDPRSTDLDLGGSEADRSGRKPSISILHHPVVNTEPREPASDMPENEREHAPSTLCNKTSRGVSTSPPSDSGYSSSPSPDRGRSRSTIRGPRRDAAIEPIPIVWTDDATELRSPQRTRQAGLNDDDDGHIPTSKSDARRTASLRSFRSSALDRGRGRDMKRNVDADKVGSISTSRYSGHRRRVSLNGGSFAAGAGTIGPSSIPRPEDTASFHARSQSVDVGLTQKQRSRVEKAGAKEGKRVAKVIKAEGKAEKAALEQAIKELADIQKMQKTGIKEESKAVAAHAKALRQFHKEELEYIAARARFERAQAELDTWESAREAARKHAADVTDMLQEKSRDVEWLRAQKAVDDREREAKLRQLTGSDTFGSTSVLGSLLGS